MNGSIEDAVETVISEYGFTEEKARDIISRYWWRFWLNMLSVIDLSKSYMIGDGENDVKAGIAAGCKTVLISDQCDSFNQDICVSSLKEFVDRGFWAVEKSQK